MRAQGARSAPGPARASTICPALFRHGTPARCLTAGGSAAYSIGRIFAAPVRHHSARKIPCLLVSPSVSHAAVSPRCSSPLRRAPRAATPARPDAVASASQAANAAPPACTTGTADLTLPAGFCATVFADSIAHARHVAVASNGDVYVTIEGTQPSPEKKISGADKTAPTPASFVALRDTNHDGRADVVKRVGSIGNTGVGLANGFLYVDEGKQIVRYARSDTALVPEGKREVVIAGIPLNRGHRARNFAIGSDGALYLNVGSATNSCQKKDRANESMGIDPCTELETRAGIWKYDAEQAEPEVLAEGALRHGHPQRDGHRLRPRRQALRDAARPRSAPRQLAEALPDDEVSGGESGRGADAGQPGRRLRLALLLLLGRRRRSSSTHRSTAATARRRTAARTRRRRSPSSPDTGRRCRSSSTPAARFPARYKDGAFIAFHGSWNRAPEPQAGYRVVFQPLANGATARRVRDLRRRLRRACRTRSSSPARRSIVPPGSRRAPTARSS